MNRLLNALMGGLVVAVISWPTVPVSPRGWMSTVAASAAYMLTALFAPESPAASDPQ